MALVLLVAAGLLGRSFWNLRHAKIGFEPDNAMAFQLSLPCVSAAGVALRLPLASRGAPILDVQLQPNGDPGRPTVAAAFNVASADYFRTMGIQLGGLPADSNPVQYQPMSVQYVIRGTQLPTLSTIQAIVKELDPRVPATRFRSLRGLVDEATTRVRLTTLLIAIAGVAALLLGVIGVYSVVAYAAKGRVREFGIRIALGAAPTRVGGMVLGDGLRLVGIGTFAGLLAAVGATRFLSALLYEVKPTSVAEFGVATVLLVVVSLFATLLPARRAARTQPAVVLRGE